MHGYSHGQPQVLREVDPDQLAYNAGVDAAFQQFHRIAIKIDNDKGVLPAVRDVLHKLNRKLYLEDVLVLRERYGHRESDALIV